MALPKYCNCKIIDEDCLLEFAFQLITIVSVQKYTRKLTYKLKKMLLVFIIFLLFFIYFLFKKKLFFKFMYARVSTSDERLSRNTLAIAILIYINDVTIVACLHNTFSNIYPSPSLAIYRPSITRDFLKEFSRDYAVRRSRRLLKMEKTAEEFSCRAVFAGSTVDQRHVELANDTCTQPCSRIQSDKSLSLEWTLFSLSSSSSSSSSPGLSYFAVARVRERYGILIKYIHPPSSGTSSLTLR